MKKLGKFMTIQFRVMTQKNQYLVNVNASVFMQVVVLSSQPKVHVSWSDIS
ncbi:conserved hypothetical protein [Histoplasma capsulatum H143]|uniref:Uncharacterized protein n=1 Tax=Ajellomyces capsulatus (strain H143) TaxID=544712 RepID=C6H5H1_AJECH|nr:conserved hypothetical protein [Histoplasma capsulatum H143]